MNWSLWKMSNRCAKCGKEASMVALFNGKWVCEWCHRQLVAKRDFDYYNKLAKQNSEVKTK